MHHASRSFSLQTGLILALIAGVALAHPKATDPTLELAKSDIDWEKAEVISILLRDHVFEPDEIQLKLNRPYKLVLSNVSDSAMHDLVDPEFFHATVIREVVIGGVVVNTHHIHNLELKPNSTASLYLVPVKLGEHDMYCSIPGHREEGMEGYVTIRP